MCSLTGINFAVLQSRMITSSRLREVFRVSELFRREMRFRRPAAFDRLGFHLLINFRRDAYRGLAAEGDALSGGVKFTAGMYKGRLSLVLKLLLLAILNLALKQFFQNRIKS